MSRYLTSVLEEPLHCLEINVNSGVSYRICHSNMIISYDTPIYSFRCGQLLDRYSIPTISIHSPGLKLS